MPTPAPARPDRKMLSALAKSLWKHGQKAAEPGLTPADLRSRWKDLRSTKDATAFKQAKDQAKLLMRAIAKAGYGLEAAPPREKGAKKKRKKAGA